ncbi:MAG: radical SAM protein [Deltaproteobacteria bacterium]|nr:radical SAM protein [Deltaproteobacteria bacterium]
MGLTPGKLIILAKWLLTRQATSVAIDVTHRCNLKCAHCYWWKQDQKEELDDGRMTAMMRRLRRCGLRAVILYGGEPTLRLSMCRAASRMGTGVYDTAVANLRKADRPPIVHMTISRLNQDAVGDFVGEMLELPIKVIGFSFFTPDRDSDDAALLVPLEERDRLVRQLLTLRARYGEKVGFTPAMARQLLTNADFDKWNSAEKCPVGRRVICFASNGRRKMCTYGDRADCSKCGCAAVVAYRGALKPPDYRTLRLVLGLMVPEYRVHKKVTKVTKVS